MANRKLKKGIAFVKPSKLPKNSRYEVRINKDLKEYLLSNGYKISDILHEALDKIIPKFEVKTTLVIEAKKPPKKQS